MDELEGRRAKKLKLDTMDNLILNCEGLGNLLNKNTKFMTEKEKAEHKQLIEWQMELIKGQKELFAHLHCQQQEPSAATTCTAMPGDGGALLAGRDAKLLSDHFQSAINLRH